MADTISSVIMSWGTGRVYAVRDVVKNAGSNYRCITAHTAGGTFAGDSAYWTALEVTPTGTVYDSLYDWVAAQSGTTVTSGNRLIVECYAGLEVDGSAQGVVDVNGFTVDSGAECIIRNATALDIHDGKWGTGYRIIGTTTTPAYLVETNFTTSIGIAAKNSYASGYSAARSSSSGVVAYDHKFFRCLFVDTSSSGSERGGYVCDMQGGVKGSTLLVNCILIAPLNTLHFYTGIDCRAYNCIIVGDGSGAAYHYSYSDTATLKNCYITNAGTNEYVTEGYTGVFTSCMHSSSQSITGSTGSVAYSTSSGAKFTNITPGSENFHLQAGSSLYDAGTDLSGDSFYPFTTDMDGVTRTSWDIGPYEYVPTGVTMTLMGGSVM